ncbi:hypothetical protein FN846DRAFT_740937 [Sphaerosporella brunnea]|uniref:Uncharacterized protein n=1 Tax=Sphaerosporella brunnea TaxID=1250544 RepID=A0A5J5EVN3_9PEZI|nr:hypothetical protein FN846DRAFT_740937 [Sphaerosporella brunnea]
MFNVRMQPTSTMADHLLVLSTALLEFPQALTAATHSPHSPAPPPGANSDKQKESNEQGTKNDPPSHAKPAASPSPPPSPPPSPSSNRCMACVPYAAWCRQVSARADVDVDANTPSSRDLSPGRHACPRTLALLPATFPDPFLPFHLLSPISLL